MGLELLGSSVLLADFKMGVTSATFQTLVKELEVKELFISRVIVERMQGALSLSMRDAFHFLSEEFKSIPV